MTQIDFNKQVSISHTNPVFFNNSLICEYRDGARSENLSWQVKSEVAIASLFRQIQQTKKKLLEVKTITKSLGNGIAESVKSCNLHKMGRILWF